MKMLLNVVLLVAAWNCAHTGAVAQDIKVCSVPYFGTFNIGSHPLNNRCGVAICKEDGKLHFDYCSQISVAPGSIIIPEDLSKPYPQCCERVIKAEDAKPCTDAIYGTYNFGKTPLTTQCGVAICKEGGKLEMKLCPSKSVDPGSIIIPQDLSKPHPQCCGRVIKAEDAKPCTHRFYGTFNFGETPLTKQCGVAICKEGRKLEMNLCPEIYVAPGSIIVPEDLSKPHPQCCERVIKAEDAKPCTDVFYGTFNFGKTSLTKQCGVAICKEGGKLEVDVCPAISVAAGSIIIPQDLSKPHPQCCERVIKAEDAIPCTDRFNQTFNFGKTPLTKQCRVAICKEGGKLEVHVCPEIYVAPGTIVIPEDLSKPYPECCERAVKGPSA